MRVVDLINQLSLLPPDTCIFTAGMEGIFPAEGGNLYPLKIFETRFGLGLYIDDGLGDHSHVSEQWISLDEYTKPCEHEK